MAGGRFRTWRTVVTGFSDADLERAILQYLADHGRTDLGELATPLGDHPVTIDRHCYTLAQEGYIRLIDDGVFTLTSKGIREL